MRRADDLSLDDLESARVGDVYPSRKNKVFRVVLDGEMVVAKVFRKGRAGAEREFSVLELAFGKGIRVPRPIELRDFGILMGLEEGLNAGAVYDSLWEGGPDPPNLILRRSDLAHSISAWLADFHRAFDFSLCRGDSVLKNFIVGPKGLTGIDFEEAVEGDPLNDLGQICSYVLSTDPMFTGQKFQFAKDVSAGYDALAGADRSEELSSKTAEALRYYSRFRRDGEVLRVWASRIESEDLLR